jgi:hypothetical protein
MSLSVEPVKRKPAPVELWVSITRYAQIYGVTRQTVSKWLGAGLLHAYRVGSVVRVRNIPPAR